MVAAFILRHPEMFYLAESITLLLVLAVLL
jgi:hypothetical protein